MKKRASFCVTIPFQKGGKNRMQNQEIYIVSQAIRYIEEHLERKIDL